MSSPVLPNAKDLGAFYTPDTIADILADWVVQSGHETLLEPSVGDGALIQAALSSAERKSFGKSNLRIVGCDIDKVAIERVRGWLSSDHSLLVDDFLDIEPEAILPVQGVLSNPPFTRNHALPKPLRDSLRKRFSIKGAAGLWVAFLLHSIRFLVPGGRLAAVIPGAALFSNYGRHVLARICDQFEHVEIRQIVDRPLWSNHADERGAIILARGYMEGSCTLPDATRWTAAGKSLTTVQTTPFCFRQALLSSTPLGELAKVSIGAVTGYNKVFLLNEAERLAANIDIEDLSLVVARGRQLKALRVSAEELLALADDGERTWLLTPRDLAESKKGVRSRLAQIPLEKRRRGVWLNKRSPWWKIDLRAGCDAMFTYMNDGGPRIVITEGNIGCTNTLHRIEFNSDLSDDDRKVVALSMVSSFGQLAAELIGRSYGGGVLKFELLEARRVPVLHRKGAGAAISFANADKALRLGQMDKARFIADALLLPAVFGSSWEEASSEMIAEIAKLRSMRRGENRL